MADSNRQMKELMYLKIGNCKLSIQTSEKKKKNKSEKDLCDTIKKTDIHIWEPQKKIETKGEKELFEKKMIAAKFQ